MKQSMCFLLQNRWVLHDFCDETMIRRAGHEQPAFLVSAENCKKIVFLEDFFLTTSIRSEI
jgi:hypothetical protein